MDKAWLAEGDVYRWALGLRCSPDGAENRLGPADSDFTDVQPLLLPPAFLPLTHPIFCLSFFTQGENEEEQNQHMKTKTWQRGEGEVGEEEQRKERQSQKTRGLSKVRDES